MKAKILIILFLSTFSLIGKAQNLISNPSFETGFLSPAGLFPTTVAQFQDGDALELFRPGCPSWTADQNRADINIGLSTQTKVMIHSPDWFDHRSGFLRAFDQSRGINIPILPRTGDKFVGQFCGEMIEQNLSSPLEACGRYRVSFFFRTGQRTFVAQGGNGSFGADANFYAIGATVKILLSHKKIEYTLKQTDFIDCGSSWLAKKSTPMELDIRLPQRAIENWTQVSIDFTAPSLETIKWIGFETTCCDGAIVFFDDFSLEKIPVSTSCLTCTPEEGAINPSFANNPMYVGDGSANSNSKPFTIKNISNVKRVNIRSKSGVSGQDFADLFSISNPGCEVKWDGRDINGNFLPEGIYFVDIELVNNCTCWRQTMSIAIFYQVQIGRTTFSNASFGNKISPLVSCCQESIVIEPEAFDVSTCQTLASNFINSFPQRHLTGPSTLKARNNITIRTNIVLNGPMTLKATNFIDVGPNVTLNGGGITLNSKEIRITSGILRSGVDMRIDNSPPDCPVQFIAEETPVYSLNTMNQSNSTSLATFSPNPTTGKLFLDLTNFNMEEKKYEKLIDIYNVQGKLILQKKLSENLLTEEIDLSNHPSGIYMLTLRINKNIHHFKVIKE